MDERYKEFLDSLVVGQPMDFTVSPRQPQDESLAPMSEQAFEAESRPDQVRQAEQMRGLPPLTGRAESTPMEPITDLEWLEQSRPNMVQQAEQMRRSQGLGPAGSVSSKVPASRDRIVDWLNEMSEGRGFAVPMQPLEGEAQGLAMEARERGDAQRAMEGKRVLRSLNAPTDAARAYYSSEDMMRPMPTFEGHAVGPMPPMDAPVADYSMGGLPIEGPPVMDRQALMALARLRSGE